MQLIRQYRKDGCKEFLSLLLSTNCGLPQHSSVCRTQPCEPCPFCWPLFSVTLFDNMQADQSSVQQRSVVVSAAATVASTPATVPHSSTRLKRLTLEEKGEGRLWRMRWLLHRLHPLLRCRRDRCLLLLCVLVIIPLLLLLGASFAFLNWWETSNLVQQHQHPPPSYSPTLVENEVARDEVASLLSAKDDGPLCLVCSAGYVLYRPANGTTAETTATEEVTSQMWTVCAPSAGNDGDEPAPLHTAGDCVTHLHHLGLLQASPLRDVDRHNDSCVTLRLAVHVVVSSAVDPSAGQPCGAVVAQLRPSQRNQHGVEVVLPRATEWPSRHDAHIRGVATPSYVGTASVREDDVDADLPPPAAITGEVDAGAFAVHFGANTEPASEPLRCPLRFLTVRLGPFARRHHHRQLQQVLHGVALAARLNRTFLLPPFVASAYSPSVRLDSAVLYGWNTLRQVGHCCLVTYREARPLLQQVEATRGSLLTVARVHMETTAVTGSVQSATQQRSSVTAANERKMRVWGPLPRVRSASSAEVLYDADEWFASGVPREPGRCPSVCPENNASVARPLLLLREVAAPPLDLSTPHPASQSRWAVWAAAAQALYRRHESATGLPSAHLMVLSSEAAFYLRPPLREATRLLGLLRPSPAITSEVGRFYRLWARHYKWPVYTRVPRTFDDCLQSSRFRAVVGVDVYAGDAERADEQDLHHYGRGSLLPGIDGPYVLEGGAEEAVWRSNSTVSPTTAARLSSDSAWDVPAVVRIIRHYAQWLTGRELNRNCNPPGAAAAAVGEGLAVRAPRQGNRSASCTVRSDTHYSAFLAYGVAAGAVAEKTEVELQRGFKPAPQDLLSDGIRPSFTAAYDRRNRVSYQAAFESARRRVNATILAGTLNSTDAVDDARDYLMLKLLYPVAEQEMMGHAFDLFMLSNTGVFRGNVLSPTSVSVCLRRWGRGLPCHGVMAGFYEVLYRGVL